MHPSFRARYFLLLTALVVGLSGAMPGWARPLERPGQLRFGPVAGEVLIGFRAGTSADRRRAVYQRESAEYLQELGQPSRPVVRVRVRAGGEAALMARLAALPDVEFVDRNRAYGPAFVPNDNHYSLQWHLPHIHAPGAWDISRGGPTIAILDTGIDSAQPDLAAKLVAGYNTYSLSTTTTDATGHGTTVAGVAAALLNNTTGVAGLAGDSPVMPVRVTSNTGVATSSTIAAGITWAVDHGARVLNISLESLGNSSLAGDPTIRAAAEYAFNHGAVVVAAAGNSGTYDATAENPFILSVAATDETDAQAWFSNSGPYVDLAAPGTNIWTTEPFGIYLPEEGTSMSSPIVAGIAALMLGSNAAVTPTVAVQLLEATAVDLGDPGYDAVYGHGRVDALAAVQAAKRYQPAQDLTAPTVSLVAPAAGASLTGSAIPVSATASDNVAVTQVDFLVDGVLVASDTTAPYAFTFDSRAKADGSHTLQARAYDAAGNSSMTPGLAVITANHRPPQARNDAFMAPVRPASVRVAFYLLYVLANDVDPDGDLAAGTLVLTAAPDNGGSATANRNGSISYTPRAGFKGAESFRYTIKDAEGHVSNEATVTVTSR